MFDPLSLLIIAGSAFMKYQADQEVADRRETFRRSMEAYQRSRTRDSQAATEQLLTKQTPQARGEELNQITADREQSLRDTVGAAQAFDAPPIAGKLSKDYETTGLAESDRIAERTRRAITQLAGMGAPEEQEHAFGRRFGVAASRVDAANSAIDNVTSGYATDIEGVRPDPFLGMVSGIGMNVGAGMLGRAGAEAASNAALDAGVNNGQGYEDAAGNLYDPGVTTRQDARIQRGLRRGFSLWGR